MNHNLEILSIVLPVLNNDSETIRFAKTAYLKARSNLNITEIEAKTLAHLALSFTRLDVDLPSLFGDLEQLILSGDNTVED